MKFFPVKEKEFSLTLPDDFYQRGGVDVMVHADTSKNTVAITLPSIKDEAKMRLWFKIFIFDVMRNCKANNIAIRPQRGERINGASEISLKLNGIAVMLIPVGKDDWMCFVPPMVGSDSPVEEKATEKKEEVVSAPAA